MESLEIQKLPCELLVNSRSVQSVHIRWGVGSSDDFEIVMTDPSLGAFALHSGFDLEARDPGSAWQRVSLEEFKAMLKESALLAVEDLPKASEAAACRLFSRVDDIAIPEWDSSTRSVNGREQACIRFTELVLYRTSIPYLRDGCVFSVPSVPTARIPLKRAGFRQSQISPSALVEPKTGCSIQLVGRDPQR